MGGFVHSNTQHGQLTINSIDFMTPMSRVFTLQRLHSRGARGSSVVIPGADGSTSRRRRRAERVYPMEMIVDGHFNSSGSAAGNPWSQLDTNMAYFANAVNPPSSNTGHSATWTWRTGATKTAYVFIEEWEVEPHPSNAAVNLVTFQLAVPAGQFA